MTRGGLVVRLVSYIAPAAPATRRPARGDEPFLRPEVGFAPAWYRQALGIDFSRRWHTDPPHRRETVRAMRGEPRRRAGAFRRPRPLVGMGRPRHRRAGAFPWEYRASGSQHKDIFTGSA
jgi:hypothetical protein